MPVEASAPGKVILLGEHAVVYGEPAVAAALDLRIRVRARRLDAGDSVVNGLPVNPQHHVHLAYAAESLAPDEAFSFETESEVPSASGLGSSAALATAGVAAILSLQGGCKDDETLARAAYDVEWRAQGGRGSPTDTTVAVHGGGVLVDREARANLLWPMERGERRWFLHDLALPPLRLVVGNTWERGRTAEQVTKVARFVRRTGFAREIMRDIGTTTREGLDAIAAHDKGTLGRLMDRAHNYLTMLGVSTPRLDLYCEAARRAGALGAKLTGSGGGGSMIALVDDDPAPVVAALRKMGCRSPIVADLGGEGVRAAEVTA